MGILDTLKKMLGLGAAPADNSKPAVSNVEPEEEVTEDIIATPEAPVEEATPEVPAEETPVAPDENADSGETSTDAANNEDL